MANINDASSSPHVLVVDPSTNVHDVIDVYNMSYRCNNDGSLNGATAPAGVKMGLSKYLSDPEGVAVYLDDSQTTINLYLYVSDFAQNQVLRCNIATTVHNLATAFTSSNCQLYGSTGSGIGTNSGNIQFFQPRGIWSDGSGNIYVADSGNHRILKFDQNMNPLTK